MKAEYRWVGGPFSQDEERRVVLVERARRVELGSAGPGRLEIPGCPDGTVLAVISCSNGRCTLELLADASGWSVTRKVSGQLQVLEVARGTRMETKSNDLLTFGAGGPRVVCRYDIEAMDLGVDADFDPNTLQSAVSPASADRRKKALEVHSAATEGDLRELEKKAVETATSLGRKVDDERRRSHFKMIGLACALLAAVGVVGFALRTSMHQTRDELLLRMGGLSRTMARSQESYEENRKLLESLRKESARDLEALQAEIVRLEKDRKDDPRLGELRAQVDAHRLELRQNASLERKFDAVQKTLDEGLFLILCRVKLSQAILPDGKGGVTEWWWSTGTGFVVDGSGRLVTCKHVVQPWKFQDLAGFLARERVTVAEWSIEALPVGTAFSPDAGSRGSSRAPNTRDRTLELLRTAPDDLQTVKIDGHACQVETNPENDVALLQLREPRAKPLRMATDAELLELKPRKLWPVMVAGFPLGLRVLEEGKIESSMTLGNVRKFERFLQHTAPTCEGNSGGPVLDQDGRVVGLVSSMLTGTTVQNMNRAVPADRINRLLAVPP
jgi:S1-C subfamily serine protease